MRVLVTGHLGYIGTVLTPMLQEAGHHVVGLDAGFFSDCVYGDSPSGPDEDIRMDVRDVEVDNLRGFDAVVHLAALSNDPMGQLNPALTNEINHLASVRLAEKARDAGVARFVFFSSCSMYGGAEGHGSVDEESPFNPLSAYARSKVDAEAGITALATDKFSPVFLRNATAYGLSPRLRFDLVLNNFVGWAVTTRKIQILSDGTPWRPMVHIRDISAACQAVLDAPLERVHNEAFNVGQEAENFQVRDIASTVSSAVDGCQMEITGESGNDARSYRVSFAKIRTMLPALQPQWTIATGAAELVEVLTRSNLTVEQFKNRRYTRLSQLEYLMNQNTIDSQLFVASGGAQ